MITIKNEQEIALMRTAGKINYETHELIEKMIQIGVTTKELDKAAENYIKSKGCIPSFKGYDGFPATICASVNDEVVHGIPRALPLQDGDVVSIDIGVIHQGYHSDSARTHIVGKTSKEIINLVNQTKNALYQGIDVVKEGAYLGDISNAIANHANQHGLGIVRELVGHGVGKQLHEDPNIPNYHTKHKGPKLIAGMTLAIEPMLNLGSSEIVFTDDWPVLTKDHLPSAHFEHTVLVTKDGYEILTGVEKSWKEEV